MNRILIALICLIALPAFAQVAGDIKNDNRKLLSEQSFTLQGTHEGVIVFKIAVNTEGEITSADVVSDESTIRSTPAKIKARNYIMGFKFEKGTWYPKFHQGTIRLTMLKDQ
jgi:hypothetical protein